ncbi:hypothetical protein BDZ94DRAFT_1233077 [Collybia nuda]|uniref:HMG box domain-containing protein n=1 Tax=Collybia nuda TaxID=64659 RepID=A0A9P5YDH8_9AGAR|nr:hypothetical protein BDZ94DRAFT_1233077 [Collybia nuda]
MDPQEPTGNIQPTPAPALLAQRRSSTWDSSPPQYRILSAPFLVSGHSGLALNMAPIRTGAQSSSEDNEEIPRPQNAFMLYRAHTSKHLRGQGVQSMISKTIGQMWRALSPMERQYWDYLADVEKMNHAAKYPHYRFNPKSKAQREQNKREKKERKEEERVRNGGRPSRRRTAAPSAAPPLPLPIGVPPSVPYSYPSTLPVYAPDATRYGTAGPSPPLSAAASPYASSSDYEPKKTDEEQSSSSNYASSSQSVTRDQSVVGSPAVALSALFNSSVLPQAPTASSTLPQLVSQWQPEQQYNAVASSSSLPEHNASQEPQEELLSFGLPQLPTSPEFDLALQAILATTNDPNIFEVNGDYDWSTANNLEIGMGQQPMAFSFDAGFDFSFMTNIDPNFNLSPTASLNTGEDPFSGFSSSYNTNPELDSYMDTSAAVTGDFFSQYVNYDDSVPPGSPDADTLSAPPTDGGNTATEEPRSYVPPAGARYASTRRVGGSWHRSFAAAESPIEVSSPQAYGVHAT